MFTHLLLRANYQDNYFGNYLIKRGQFAISREKLSAQTGLTIKQIRLVESKLQLENTLVTEKTPFFMLYTIVNYENYQSKENIRATEG